MAHGKPDPRKFTPLFRQWLSIKQRLPDTLVLFRLGDFYEMFGEDAEVGARELGLTLTSRECYPGQRIAMCGVPHHALNRYLRQLIERGYRAAVVEQVEDPKKARGLVRREVTRIVTPGTVIEDELLGTQGHNFLASVAVRDGRAGIAAVDVSAAQIFATELPLGQGPARRDLFGSAAGGQWQAVVDELSRLQPAEILLAADIAGDDALRAAAEQIAAAVTVAEEEAFADPARELEEFFEVATLDGFGLSDKPAAQAACAQALRYLRQQRPDGLPKFPGITTYSPARFMILDEATRRNLEIERTIRDGQREGSLLGVLDKTRTAMGARLLRMWLLQPLVDVDAIRRRLDAVEELVAQRACADELREALDGVYDIERLTARCTAGRANARDLRALCNSLKRLPEIRSLLAERASELLRDIGRRIGELGELCALLDAAIAENPPATLDEGGVIREGFSQELDELRQAAASGRQWIAELQERERARTGIKSLRIGYNQVFGYYIEVTKPNLHLVPPDYERRQTLANAERFITPELKQMEEKILGAEERALELEAELFRQVREQAAGYADQLHRTARALAELDVLLSYAQAAVEYGYCKPEVDESDVIEIRDGRHPVVERLQTDEPFVPNDCYVDTREHRMLIITGPNMAGKSTYLRQVALIALMAQAGSFVPARAARIGVVDRIFTRVGASDDLASGRSTFLVEMTETANILHNATDRSLIILDEIGRGTSTFDGLSIAWAVAEHICRHIRARTLFATHYHHLNELERVMEGVRNYRIAVREEGDRIIFLRKIMPGGTDRSYGIQVARLAGVPEEVIERAREILAQLEQEDLAAGVAPRREAAASIGPPVQLTLFEVAEHPALKELRGLDIDTLSPIEALLKLKELKEMVERRRSGRGDKSRGR